jgi:hypothetical protein
VPLVAQPRRPLATGEPSPAAEGTSVRIFGLEGLAVKVEGIVVKVQKFQGPECIYILLFLGVLTAPCKIHIKS